MIIPIRTETEVRRTPWVNYGLIGANVALYLLIDLNPMAARELKELMPLDASWPRLYQFFTYQFGHGDASHLLGNMLFLWVFGNSVNGKMGHLPYLFFYLAGGVFAGLGYALYGESALIGASGAIAAVTTAYLALFPRSHVIVLLWLFYFIDTIRLPAIIMIGLKVILWDNVIAPRLGGPSNVAYEAHLAGYGFGFVASMFMLTARGLPRDQFDMLALMGRWRKRQAFRAAMNNPQARTQAQYGRVARTETIAARERSAEERQLDQISDLRAEITANLEARQIQAAATLYERLMQLDAKQCLSERNQLEVARAFYDSGRYTQAIAAFERHLACYPASSENDEIRLLIGIIYARELGQLAAAQQYLSGAVTGLPPGPRRDQAERWLADVHDALRGGGGAQAS